MSEEAHFELYECTVEDNAAFIRVNVDLQETAPDPEFPHVLLVRVWFRDVRPDGLPGPTEFDPLNALEDALMEALAPSPFAGVVSTAGVRSWCFYCSDPVPAATRALELAAQHLPDHEVEQESFEDASWSQYSDVLYPNVLAWRYIEDRRILDVLRQHGDAGDTPREVMHWAYFTTKRQRKRFVKAIKKLGYALEELGEAEGELPYCARFTHTKQISPCHIFPLTERLYITAEEHEGRYDGWETRVVPTED